MHNLPRFRGMRRMTMSDLSEKLAELGRPMSVPTLSAVENGKRRIDVDDLVYLSVALDVSPVALMMPSSNDPTADLDLAPGAAPWTTTLDWWLWLTAAAPLWSGHGADPHEVETWRRDTTPPWVRKPGSDG